MKTIKAFAEQSHISEELIRAVVRQCGGWESFQEMAQDVANCGADGGFSGFIYYTDTVKFYNNNRDSIIELAQTLAEDLGEHLIVLIEGFNCLRGSSTSEGVERTIYGPKRDVDTTVANSLAWFALEEVCLSYCDLSE